MSIYNYAENIKITTTPNGDKVIVMDQSILTALRNNIYEAAEKQKEDGLEATAADTMEMWAALINAEER